jgi:DNA invertase Pin-like site-specific DNA recombinase
MKAVGYVRVSTQEQVESGLSLENQERRIRGHCKTWDIELVEIFKEKNGVSGSKPLAERPEGSRLVKACTRYPRTDEAPVDTVIILKLDRAFRNVTDCLQMVKWWEQQGIKLVILDMGGNAIDTQSPQGKFMLVVLAGAAEMERDLISDRTKSALAERKNQGLKTGGYIAYGFNKGPRGEMIPNPDEQKVIDFMVRLSEKGMSYRAIADALNTEGHPPKRGKVWYAPGVRRTILARKEEEKTTQISRRQGRPSERVRGSRKTKKR